MSNQNVHLQYRSDIDGLRGIAVLGVIFYHVNEKMLPGGFVGVDIFFVISGFLISSIVFGSIKIGSFSLSDFYKKRVVRIFPALIVVLVAVIIAGWFLLISNEFKMLGKHTAAGAFFVSNFVLWQEVGYWDKAAEFKPLLHLWSLGIEEQFYIFWPIVGIILYKKNINDFSLILILIIVSFVFNVVNVSNNPKLAFYFPFTRFWEIFIGALLAYIMIDKKELIAVVLNYRFSSSKNTMIGRYLSVQNVFSFLGLFLLFISFVIVSNEDKYPGWQALLPTVGTFLFILTGEKASVNRSLFSNKILVYIGLISYPLYLWHWPFLSFVRIIEEGNPSIKLELVALLFAFICAICTYHFVETPIRMRKKVKFQYVLTVLIGLIGGVGVYINFAEQNYSYRADLKHSYMKVYNIRNERSRYTIWPNTHNNYCKARYPFAIEDCQIYDKNKPATVALIGDSHSNHFYPGLSLYYSKKRENLVHIGKGGCLPAATGAGGGKVCVELMKEALNTFAYDINIKTVIFVANWGLYVSGHRLNKQEWPDRYRINVFSKKENQRRFSLKMNEAFDLLERNGKEIVFIRQVPELPFRPEQCLPRTLSVVLPNIFTTNNVQCQFPYKLVKNYLETYKSVIDELLMKRSNIKIFDPIPLFCDGITCKYTQDGVLLYRDWLHLSYYGSIFVGNNYFL